MAQMKKTCEPLHECVNIAGFKVFHKLADHKLCRFIVKVDIIRQQIFKQTLFHLFVRQSEREKTAIFIIFFIVR